MRRISVLLAAALLAPAPLSAGAPEAGVTEVSVRDNRFSPSKVTVGVGSRVHWARQPGSANEHNVRQGKRLFISGPPTFGDIDFTAVFSAGRFPYFCEVHRFVGMTGVVRVPVTIAAAPAGRPFSVRWATRASTTGAVYDVQYRIEDGPWRTWRADTGARKGVFGKNGRPVPAKKGTTYSFRARSQKSASSPSKVSRWSPPRSFRV